MRYFKLTIKYISNLLIAIFGLLRAIDCAINSLCCGDPRETVSSRLGKDRTTDPNADFWARVVDRIFFWQENHCTNSIDPTVGADEIL